MTSFTMTPPTSRVRCAWNARLMSFVNTPACSPYFESLTLASASSKVWYGLIVTTGPKTSSRQTFISGFTSREQRRLEERAFAGATREHLGALGYGLVDPFR